MSIITVAELALWQRGGFAFELLDVRRAQVRVGEGSDVAGGHWLDWKAASQPVLTIAQEASP